jgi:hypothetical protein
MPLCKNLAGAMQEPGWKNNLNFDSQYTKMNVIYAHYDYPAKNRAKLKIGFYEV